MAMNLEVLRSAKEMLNGNTYSCSGFALAWEQIRSPLRRLDRDDLEREANVRLEERRRERARIARELHDTLFQGVFGASLLLHSAADQLPADSPGKLPLTRALHLIQSVLDEARFALQGLRRSDPSSASLEKALSALQDEFGTGRNVEFRILVTGQSKTLNPVFQEQVYLIGREALINALRHSEATRIDAEIEYMARRIRLLVRDNGRGIDPKVLRSGRASHWGLQGMQERAASLGAKLRIWSRVGVGTEVEISVPANFLAPAYTD